MNVLYKKIIRFHSEKINHSLKEDIFTIKLKGLYLLKEYIYSEFISFDYVDNLEAFRNTQSVTKHNWKKLPHLYSPMNFNKRMSGFCDNGQKINL